MTIHGKGRKQREVPLWKTTVKYINKYLKTYTAECTDYLFINKNGDELTRSGVRTRINKLVSQATDQVPSLREKTVTPHTFRHSVAMNLCKHKIMSTLTFLGSCFAATSI